MKLLSVSVGVAKLGLSVSQNILKKEGSYNFILPSEHLLVLFVVSAIMSVCQNIKEDFTLRVLFFCLKYKDN